MQQHYKRIIKGIYVESLNQNDTERKYHDYVDWVLKTISEIAIIVGTDDTSTTLISPGLFEDYNNDITDKRVEHVHSCGKLYMHHSCGLIKDLLAVCRKTKMDCVHAFTTSPFGDVTFEEGRKLLKPDISVCGSYETGLGLNDSAEHMKEVVSRRSREVQNAKHVILMSKVPDSS